MCFQISLRQAVSRWQVFRSVYFLWCTTNNFYLSKLARSGASVRKSCSTFFRTGEHIYKLLRKNCLSTCEGLSCFQSNFLPEFLHCSLPTILNLSKRHKALETCMGSSRAAQFSPTRRPYVERQFPCRGRDCINMQPKVVFWSWLYKARVA